VAALQGLQRSVVALAPRVTVLGAQTQLAEQAVPQAVNEAMHLDAMPSVPRTPQDGGATHVSYLLDHVQLCKPRGAVFIICRGVEPGRVLVRDVLDVAQPIIASPVERFSATA
jgi:hypothetical protein